MDPNVCPNCGGDLESNNVFYVCEVCFTPYNAEDLAPAWQAKWAKQAALVDDQIVVRRDGAVATVVINRPEQRNAITLAMWHWFARLFEELDADDTVGLVIVTGSGDQAFSAGADVKEFEETRSTPQKAREYGGAFEQACDALAAMSTPSVAAVRGYCYGGGFELALSADIRVAAETSAFAIPAARMGLAIGHTFVGRMMALVGPGHTGYLLLTGRSIAGAEARDMGLVNAVVPNVELDAYLTTLAADLLALSPNSHRVHKQAIRDLLEFGAPGNVPKGRLMLPRTATESADFKEGVRAFMEKRSPRFHRGAS